MHKKEVFINKKTMYISMNASLVLSSLFLFLMLGNTSFAKKYSFIETISDFAKTSETKTFNVTVSADSKEQHRELLTFNGANINNHDVYDNSVLTIPNQNNKLELVLGENKISPKTFMLRTLFSSKRTESEEFFKLESDNLYINRFEDPNPPNTKSVVVTTSVAQKIANFLGKEEPAEALGKMLNFDYFDFSLERVSVPHIVKGIVLEDVGIMPTYKTNYGDDLIFLAANAYDYNIADTRLDVRYSQSVYRNLMHTEAFIKEFGADRMSFVNNVFLSTSQIENLNAGFQSTFIQSQIFKNPAFITFLVLFILSFAFAMLCLVLYFKNYNREGRRHNFISIVPFLTSLVIFYIISTIMNFIMKHNVMAGAYLTAPRSLTFLIFLAINVIIISLPSKKTSKKKGIEIDEKDKS